VLYSQVKSSATELTAEFNNKGTKETEEEALLPVGKTNNHVSEEITSLLMSRCI